MLARAERWHRPTVSLLHPSAGDRKSRRDIHTRQPRCDTKRNRGSIPGIDRDHRGSEIDEFLFREMTARLVVHVIRYVTVADLRHRFGPGEGGTLACAVDWCLAPGVEQMHPLVALAMLACIVGVHDDAVGAAVDLRGADFDEI